MKERPILFNGRMVCGVLDKANPKTQSRRIVTGFEIRGPQPHNQVFDWYKNGKWVAAHKGNGFHPGRRVGIAKSERDSAIEFCCPYGIPGDRLWVRENFYHDSREGAEQVNPAVIYAATPELAKYKLGKGVEFCRYPTGGIPTREASQKNLDGHRFQRLKPSIHMPRWASRITLEITEVRVQRLQEISEADCKGEGCPGEFWKDGTMTLSPYAQFKALWESINGPGSWDENPWLWCLTFKRIET